MVEQVSFTSTTNMWAVLDKENIVLGCIIEASYEKALEQSEGHSLIEMTTENSPAVTGQKWNGKKFIWKGEDNA